MSTGIEDHLTGALQARAELVQPEDLRHLTLPSATSTPIWRRPAVVGLVAAAAVAAVVIPIVLRGDHTVDHPLPATRLLAPSESLAGDVDGDGRPDRINASDGRLTLRRAVRPDLRVSTRVPHLGGLLGLIDIGSLDRGIVVATGHRTLHGRSRDVYSLVRGKLRVVPVDTGRSGPLPFDDGLVEYPGRAIAWLTADGVLMTGALDPAQDGAQHVAVQVSRSAPEGGGLVQRPVGTWCWDSTTHQAPAPCPDGVSYAYDPGSHGSLPALLPAASPGWIRNAGSHRDSWQDGGTSLRIVKGQPITSSPSDQTYDVVGTVDGQRVKAQIGEARALLYATYVDLGHGVRGLVANDSQASTWNLLALTDHGLVPLSIGSPSSDAGGQFSLHPGTFAVRVRGRLRLATTWIAGGKVFTRVATKDVGRFQTYEWQVTDSSGTTLRPVDLGKVCIDDFAVSYGTCPR
jgi:hypothetical protein